MIKRNSDRDTLKIKSWEDYVSKINYSAPTELEKCGAVDRFLIFNTADDEVFKKSFDEAMKMILED